MARKKVEAKVTNKLKKKLAEKRKTAPDAKKKGPGRPPTRGPLVGYEINNKDQNKLGNDFSNLQKQFDTIGENVSKFAFEADADSATSAFKELVQFQKNVKTFCKTVRSIKKNLKPKYGELPA
jgi:hypothetical protein